MIGPDAKPYLMFAALCVALVCMAIAAGATYGVLWALNHVRFIP